MMISNLEMGSREEVRAFISTTRGYYRYARLEPVKQCKLWLPLNLGWPHTKVAAFCLYKIPNPH